MSKCPILAYLKLIQNRFISQITNILVDILKKQTEICEKLDRTEEKANHDKTSHDKKDAKENVQMDEQKGDDHKEIVETSTKAENISVENGKMDFNHGGDKAILNTGDDILNTIEQANQSSSSLLGEITIDSNLLIQVMESASDDVQEALRKLIGSEK